MPLQPNPAYSMHDLWESFAAEVIRKAEQPLTYDELQSIKKVFYAGMIGTFSALVVHAPNDENAGLEQLNDWHKEVREYLTTLKTQGH